MGEIFTDQLEGRTYINKWGQCRRFKKDLNYVYKRLKIRKFLSFQTIEI